MGTSTAGRGQGGAALRRAWVALTVLALVALLPVTGTHAVFTGRSTAASTVAAAPDWLPPTISRVVTHRPDATFPGFISSTANTTNAGLAQYSRGNTYRLYAYAVDDPASPSPTATCPSPSTRAPSPRPTRPSC